MKAQPSRKQLASLAAILIVNAFDQYNDDFRAITQRSLRLFEQCRWPHMQQAAAQRIDLYRQAITETVGTLAEALGPYQHDQTLWAEIKAVYAESIDAITDRELNKTFFNSLTRRFFGTIGVNHQLEFVDIDVGPIDDIRDFPPLRHYRLDANESTATVLLRDCGLDVEWQDFDRDAKYLHARLLEMSETFTDVELLYTPFIRHTRCLLVGRAVGPNHSRPFLIALLNDEQGLRVDAVIQSADTVSILFGFTRSYFHADLHPVGPAVRFLKTLIPDKSVAELYTVVGRAKQGKTERYRRLFRHLRRARDKFQVAPGSKGMVMIVFTLPSHDIVFKVIRDQFAWPKTVQRQQVLESYDLIFRHDRVGRLVDAQEFRRLRFRRSQFSDQVLAELTDEAARSITLSKRHLIIDHLYIERRLTPLNLYLNSATPEQAKRAVIDYGQAVRDLAMSNVFPGDLLLKNFGVTRHGRVVFYDYDEVVLMSQCQFKPLPPARDEFEEMSEQVWFEVEPDDIFPEQFASFISLDAGLMDTFVQHHGELLTWQYWHGLKDKLAAGEVLDVRPYPEQAGGQSRISSPNS